MLDTMLYDSLEITFDSKLYELHGCTLLMIPADLEKLSLMVSK
jgi:hypothetical protein